MSGSRVGWSAQIEALLGMRWWRRDCQLFRILIGVFFNDEEEGFSRCEAPGVRGFVSIMCFLGMKFRNRCTNLNFQHLRLSILVWTACLPVALIGRVFNPRFSGWSRT